MTPTITSVPVDLIDPHPNNPRRELGDLTELADSIRAHGVRQNLLLVPQPCPECGYLDTMNYAPVAGGYPCPIDNTLMRATAVIGHRRLAAARMAGLTEVPAVIDTNLSAADQVELMLLENVQRSDLSPVEEAEGYQQLLDLGVKVTMIAKRTGRARKTIDSRLKLLTLPEDAREKVHAGQVSLMDAAALAEFEDDPEVHAALLDKLGTADWDWKIAHERSNRKDRAKRRKLADKIIELGAVEVADSPTGDGYVFDSRIYSDSAVPDGVEPGWLIVVLSYAVELWRPATDDEKLKGDKSAAAKARREEKQRAEDEARALVEAERATAHDRRDEFVRSLIGRKTFKPAERAAIVGALARTLMTGGLSSTYAIRETLGYDGKDWALADEWRVEQGITPEAALVVAMHVSIGPLKWGGWEKVGTNRAAQTLYTLLGALGMVLSDVERSRVFPAAEDAS